MRKLLFWLDQNLLFILTGFLLAFIPLFPKLPLFEILPGYIVRIRSEDFLISFTLIIWLIQLWRKKINFGPNPLARPILVYLIIGVLSMISAVFITQTVPYEGLHIGKMILHFLRRVEYFSLFFVFFSSVKSIKQVKIYLTILILTVVGVTIYGYGQKYLYWPAFSTMNREFAKGWALYLTQHARVISTFGGHYDLAAFIMAILVLLWALFFSLRKWYLRIIIFIILSSTFWLLILTASRTSFIAYILAVSILFGLLMFTKGLGWAASRWLIVVSLSIVVMLSFGDLSERFTKLLKLDQRLGGLKNIILRPITNPPAGNVAFLVNSEAKLEDVTSKSDFPLLPNKPTDVIDDMPDGFLATQSATGTAMIVSIPRTYSRTALVYDLSTGIRLDALWPRAIAGFKLNPILGSGYSTLTKTQVQEFTEAESTDNDFLRSLGETGILGFLSFGWILVSIVIILWQTFTRIRESWLASLVAGLLAVIFGLLVNAIYIDIFEASKIAFTFWALVGIVLGAIKVLHQQHKLSEDRQAFYINKTIKLLKTSFNKIILSPKTYLLAVILLAFGLRLYRIHEPLADWHSWRQADTSAVTRNFIKYGVNPLYPRYDDLSSIASGKPNPQGYRLVEFPIYNMAVVVVDTLFTGYTVEFSGRLTSIFASLGTMIFLYYLVKKYHGVKVAWLTAFIFAVLPYNIFWSRVILPEPTLVFLTCGMLYFFDRWLEKNQIRFWFISLFLAILALLVKFTTIFFICPMLYLCWRKWGKKMIIQPSIWIFGILTLIPFAAWRWHISHFPEGIPAYWWLLNSNGIRFKGSWWWWLFAERIAKLILGGWGVVLLGVGLIKNYDQIQQHADKLTIKYKIGSTNWLFHFWLLGLLIYLAVFATGNVQHDYYQIILVPILCIFSSLGISILWQKNDLFHQKISRLFTVVIVIFMLMFGWYQARDFYNINHPEIVEAGREFDRLVSNKNVKVIAPYNGDTAFLYQTGKRGWPIVEGSTEEMIMKGAHYYISVNFDNQTNELINQAKLVELGKDITHDYKIIKLTNLYVIIQLVADNKIPKG